MRVHFGLSAPLVAIAATAAAAVGLENPEGIGRLPAMGWNSWNEYACDINEDVFLKVSDLLIALGLKDAGYNYVNIDDCWSNLEQRRDGTTSQILPDYNRFPDGIKGLAEKIHAKGLRMGIYSDAGTSTCGGYEGSLGFEDIDAATFAEWGIDYLKYDNCFVPNEWGDEYYYDPQTPPHIVPPADYDYGNSNTAERYYRMRNALLAQDRIIEFSLCAWGHAHVERWGNETGHSWRMWGDIRPTWAGREAYNWGLMPIVNQAARHWNDTVDFWGHNDWDMLEVGNGDLTFEENRSHFALWAAFKSPLIMGTRLQGVTQEVVDILTNRELIEFNQDAYYGPGVRPFNYGSEIPPSDGNTLHPPGNYVGISSKGMHLFLLNTQDEDRDITIDFADVPGVEDGEYMIHDMWTGEDIGVSQGSVTVHVKRHDTAALRLNTLEPENPHPNPSWMPSFSG